MSDTPPEGDGVRDQLDRILSGYQALESRFAQAGGLANLLSLYEQIRREVERISYDEIDRMTREIKAVVEALLKMDYELRRVINLKRVFDGKTGSTEGAG